jgi:hypothetical protein
MKKGKILTVLILLAVCLLFLLMADQSGFIPAAWAKKPDKPPGQEKEPEYTTVYGYAMLANRDGDKIQSDLGQYIDCTLEGENGKDFVEMEIYNNDSSLKRVEVYCGKITYHHPDCDPSTRRAIFDFAVYTESETTGNAIYDILRWYRENGDYVERRTDAPGFLEEDSVHAVIHMNADEREKIEFVVDPSDDGQNPRAITQSAVDAFYDDDKNIDYWNTSQFDEPGQIIYSLYYGNDGFDISATDRDEDGSLDTWVLTPKNPDPVILGAYRQKPGPPGITELARYDAVPFQLIVSLNSLENYPAAPGKHDSLSALWGKIKTQ